MFKTSWGLIRREGLDKTLLSLVDQVIVSGTRFATTVLVGRYGSDAELGIYALAFSLIVLVISFQESLISIPYTVFVKRLSRPEQVSYSGSSLVQAIVLNAVAVLLLLIACVFAGSLGIANNYVWLLLVLAICLPFMMLREFARRYAFAHLSMGSVLLLDVAVGLIQIGGLILLTMTATLDAVSAYVVTGLACLLVGAVWYLYAKSDFQLVRSRMAPDAKRNWEFGKWVAGAHLISVVHLYFAHWLLMAHFGEGSTGVYTACMTVLVFANPFILGVSNILSPKAAHLFADKGVIAVRSMIRKYILLVAFVLIIFAILATAFGEQIVVWIFGDEYQGNEITISVLAFGTIAMGISYVVASGLRAIDQPAMNVWAGLSGLGVTIVVSLIIVVDFAILGTAIGLVAGFFAMAIHRWISLEVRIANSE